VSPTPRAAWLLAAVALSALVLGPALAVALAVALAGATAADALSVRRRPGIVRRAPALISRGSAAPLTIEVDAPTARRARVRQPAAPGLAVSPQDGDGGLAATVLAGRRGRHLLPGPAVRLEGRLGLARWDHGSPEPAEVAVYPDLVGARRIVQGLRSGRIGGEGRLRGPLGLGTDFESIRDYQPDDDIRQVNWRATERLGRPMSNQYRIERDREVILAVDAGRLMAAPLGDRSRLDAALDAAVAVALAVDELGDRCGAIAFDAAVRVHLPPRRRGAGDVVRALFDLASAPVDSDYERAFRLVGGSRRAIVLVATDLLEEAAARPLVEAVPALARRHVVLVASALDPDLDAIVRTPPRRPLDVYAAAAALDMLAARARAAAAVERAGGTVVEAPAALLPAACVRAYLRAKARARL
jgi:uncharacterized protein (DUF58 family)